MNVRDELNEKPLVEHVRSIDLSRQSHSLPRTQMSLRLIGPLLALACLSRPVLGAPIAGNASGQEKFDNANFCLPVHGTVADSAAMLRLAAPPMDPLSGYGSGKAYLSRMLGAGRAPGPNGTTPQVSAGALGWLLKPSEPVVQLLVDGSADLLAGRYVDAQRQLSECGKRAAGSDNSLAEAACANNLAVAFAVQGKSAQARSELERALRLYDKPRSAPGDSDPGSATPLAANSIMSMLQRGLDRLPPELRAQMEGSVGAQQSGLAPKIKEAATNQWRLYERLNTLRGIERTNLNLGNLALTSGRLEDAQVLLKRAMDAHPANESPQCKSAAAADLARLYRRLNRPAESQVLLTRYGAAKRTENDGEIGLLELGTINLAAANAEQVGTSAEPARKPEIPRSRGQESREQDVTLPFALTEPAGRFSDTALSQLLARAVRDTATKPGAQATESWQRLALRASVGQRPDMEFSAHAALMRLHLSQREADAATFHGKRAANLAQTMRAALADTSPSRDSRRAFLKERRQVYVVLAQTLLDQQRLQEAEAVLQLLKEDEGQQFIGVDQRRALGSVPLTVAEQTLQRQDDEVSQQLLKAEAARASAVAALPIGAGVISMMSPVQVESYRMKLGLAMPGLAAQLKRNPLHLPGDDGTMQAMVREIRGFFSGPGGRPERFLEHLLEDSRYFEPPVSTRDRAQLADSLRRWPQIQAELAPQLRDQAMSDGPNFSISVGRKAPEDEDQVWNYVMAEPLEKVWRSINESDALEARHAQRRSSEGSAQSTNIAKAARTTNAADESLSMLASQPVTTALLYYLPGDERLDALLVTPKGRRHFRMALPRTELDASVDAFVTMLKRTDRDPRPIAREMYDRLFAPVAQAVADSGARVLALSLAGKLRFVPFAALYSGQGWLVERYALALHPGGPLTGRLKPASPNWRATAFGATLGGGEFLPLSNVRTEIAAVVRKDGAAGGVLPGDAWLDQAFTAQRLRSALAGGANVLHIASHFKFVKGDADASYLLLGDGGKLSLRELAGPDYRFDRTELVTLSACTTGLSADDTFGQEVDGLAALLMGQGAPSVLASLWEVNDKSTATLMASMYRLRERQQLSRAAALQQAQLAMIRAAGSESPIPQTADSPTRSVSRVRLPGDPEPEPADSAFAAPASLGYGHPFHWAAFVLMGNWR